MLDARNSLLAFTDIVSLNKGNSLADDLNSANMCLNSTNLYEQYLGVKTLHFGTRVSISYSAKLEELRILLLVVVTNTVGWYGMV